MGCRRCLLHSRVQIVLLEAANIALNLLHQHKKRLAAERRAAALQEQLGQQGTAAGDGDGAEEARQACAGACPLAGPQRWSSGPPPARRHLFAQNSAPQQANWKPL